MNNQKAKPSSGGPQRFLGNVRIAARQRSQLEKCKNDSPDLIDGSIVEGMNGNETTDSSNCTLSTQEKLEMSHWGLPDRVLAQYQRKGITTMFPWQMECLILGKVLEGGNLVYSAPTSAGKSLVAEILLIKRVLETEKKGILILPFVSLAREKMFALQALLRDVHVRVFGFMGSQAPPGGIKRADIAVCTIEKANSIINRLLEEGNLSDVGCVVVDELHLLGDPSRGYLLELLLTKIRYVSLRQSQCDIQIIGMSATLPNLDMLAAWLDADLYKTDFRPVPLTEHIKIGRTIYDNNFEIVKSVKPTVNIAGDKEDLTYLCLETILNGHSVLIFCPTKNWCEKLALSVSKDLFNIGSGKINICSHEIRDELRSELNGKLLSEVIEHLKRSPAGLDEGLAKAISFGVAYHHAGLTFDERDIIEGAFKRGVLRVLVATSTLSSGVNLPARRVIVRCPFTFQNQLIDTLAYKQMIGRAGRKGVDTEGESILICKESEKAKVAELVSSNLEPVQSCLIQSNGEKIGSAMKRAILEVISSGVAKTPEEVKTYSSCTMLAASIPKDPKKTRENSIQDCVQFLEENEFIRLQTSTTAINKSSSRYFYPTQLGMACLASSLSPEEGLHVFSELQKARKCFVLENELHILYQVVPIYAAVSWPNLDWMSYLSLWESLSVDMKRVGDLVGVEERFLVRAARGTLARSTSLQQSRNLAVHQRFYTALALHELVNETPLKAVSEKYGASKGMLQSLQQAASTFAGMVTAFCHKLGWFNLELLLGQFQDRLQFGVQRELIDLCRLSTLNGQRARILYNAKIETVALLANANIYEVENIFQNAAPFQSGKQGDDETAREANKRTELRSFWVTGQKGLTIAEASEVIVEEARDILQKDLGIVIDWNSEEDMNKNKSLITSKIEESKSSLMKLKRGTRKKKNNSSTYRKTSHKRKTHSVSLTNSKSAKRTFPTNTTEQAKFKDVKVLRKSLDHNSPNAITCSSSKMNSDHENCPTSNTKYDMSFDMSGQMEEIFETEGDEGIVNAISDKKMNRSKLKSLKIQREIESIDASPTLKTNQVAKQILSDDSEEDVFADSFVDNLSELDEILKASDRSSKKPKLPKLLNNKTVEVSCPRTPNLTVCDSEDLMKNWNEETKLDSSSKCKTKLMGEESMLSDSFWDRALDSHMSEGTEVTPSSRILPKAAGPEKSIFKLPSSSTKNDDSPAPRNRSHRLAKRKKAVSIVTKSQISPGNLILSDSESDNLIDSPINVIKSETHNKPELRIVDVCSDVRVFQAFSREWSAQGHFSMALACVQIVKQDNANDNHLGIGARLIKRKSGKKTAVKPANSNFHGFLSLTGYEVTIVGLAISWCDHDAYYLSLIDEATEDLDESLNPNPTDSNITLSEKMKLIKSILQCETKPLTITMFDVKEHLKRFFLCFNINWSSKVKFTDPKVASWILDPTEKDRNLANLTMNWDQTSVPLLDILGSSNGCGSVALNGKSGRSSGRLRAVAESILARRLMPKLSTSLETHDMLKAYRDVEMRSQVTLARMELNGVGFSNDESEKQRKIIFARMAELEELAYHHAGHPFSLTSPDEICRVLYDELKLPINGDPSISRRPLTRSTQLKSKGLQPSLSSSKDILIKLKQYHDLPAVILEWRKLNMSITKVVFPMQKAKLYHPSLNMDRIYTNCKTNTATGRISLHEPNIQNIPRDFEIAINEDLIEKALGSKYEMAKLSQSLNQHSKSILDSYIEESGDGGLKGADEKYCVSMRHSIVATRGFLILAVDYSQLELRILAHFSGDKKLNEILNKGEDVFRLIASSWKKISVQEVTDQDRQQAKQICYGMIYGIGTKSLGENLGIVEEEAAMFMSDFITAYPGIKNYMDAVLVKCKKVGYVETMNGRRRYLPKITESTNYHVRAASERQAINTTIQGSAADLVKSAMNEIDKRICDAYPVCKLPLRSKRSKDFAPEGAYFILQMHDELIYEVHERNVVEVAKIVKMVMENCCQLSVKTPVKIKVGSNWGELCDMKNI